MTFELQDPLVQEASIQGEEGPERERESLRVLLEFGEEFPLGNFT